MVKSDQILVGKESVKFPREADRDGRLQRWRDWTLSSSRERVEAGYRTGSVGRFSNGKLRKSPCGSF